MTNRLIEAVCKYSMLSKDGLATLADSVQNAPRGQDANRRQTSFVPPMACGSTPER